MKNNPKSRSSNLVVQELENEILIYDLNNNQAFCLNETSASVWAMCDGENSITDISEAISKKLKTKVSEEFVWLALDKLKSINLLDESKLFEIKFNRLSRREVIKKAGLASTVALPLIASVVAPSAAMAQSGACGSVGQSCSGSGVSTCCPGTAYCLFSGITATFTCTACLAPGSNFNWAGSSCPSYQCCSGKVVQGGGTVFDLECFCLA